MRRISRLEQGARNVEFLFSSAQETTDSDLLDEVRHWTQPPDRVSSWSELMEKLTDSFLSAVKNTCLQNKLYTIKQRPGENTTAYIWRFLSDAKLSYPTARAMGEEKKVVSFLNRFTESLLATCSGQNELGLSEQQYRWPSRRMLNEKKKTR